MSNFSFFTIKLYPNYGKTCTYVEKKCLTFSLLKLGPHQFQSCQTSPRGQSDLQQFSPKFNSSDDHTSARDVSDPPFDDIGHNFSVKSHGARKFSPKFNNGSNTEFNSSEPSSPGWTTSGDQHTVGQKIKKSPCQKTREMK